MAKVHAWIVHDETGRIVAVARLSPRTKAIVQTGAGQSVFRTDVEEDVIPKLASGSHKIDVERNSIVHHSR